MTRLILLILLGLVSTSYFPDSRQMLLDIAAPIYVPAIRWSAQEEMAQVGRNVIAHELRTGQLPDRSAWLPWLDYRYSSDDLRTDPWGSVYRLRVWSDSIAIVSNGLDLTRDTADDFQVVTPRERMRPDPS